jgi:hypothetical protein
VCRCGVRYVPLVYVLEYCAALAGANTPDKKSPILSRPHRRKCSAKACRRSLTFNGDGLPALGGCPKHPFVKDRAIAGLTAKDHDAFDVGVIVRNLHAD